MIAFPVASDARAATNADAPVARTVEAASRVLGGPVYLAAEELPEAYGDIAAAERAFPGLYGDARYEVVWRDKAWRIVVRYWRAAPLAPIAANAMDALRKPIGRARTPEEAQALLDAPAELTRGPAPRRYRTIRRARAFAGEALDMGLAVLKECEDGAYEVHVTFWRPIAAPGAPLTRPERTALAERAAAPLRSEAPQAEPYIGLFERLAPENPAIVLAEEGDGRTRGE